MGSKKQRLERLEAAAAYHVPDRIDNDFIQDISAADLDELVLDLIEEIIESGDYRPGDYADFPEIEELFSELAKNER